MFNGLTKIALLREGDLSGSGEDIYSAPNMYTSFRPSRHALERKVWAAGKDPAHPFMGGLSGPAAVGALGGGAGGAGIGALISLLIKKDPAIGALLGGQIGALGGSVAGASHGYKKMRPRMLEQGIDMPFWRTQRAKYTESALARLLGEGGKDNPKFNFRKDVA